MTDHRLQLRKILLHIAYEGRAARGGEKTFFRKLRRLSVGNHVRAERYLHNTEETELLKRRNHLSQFRIAELAADRGGDDGVYLVLAVLLAATQQVDRIQQIGFILNGAKRTLVYAWLGNIFRLAG